MVKSSSAGFTLLASCILFVIIVVLNLILYLILLVYLCKAPRGLFWHFCTIQAPHIIFIILATMISVWADEGTT